jgi:hypothetical protein
MLLLSLSAAAAVSACSNHSLNDAAESVLRSLRSHDYDCIRKIIKDPELKFPEGKIDKAVLDSFSFRASGHASYNDILTSGPIFVDISNFGRSAKAFYIEGRYKKLYASEGDKFMSKFFMKRYFTCAFVKENGRWLLTRDLCFTEQDYH